MRRWNGWGDDAIHASISEEVLGFLEQEIGPATSPRDAALEEVVTAVPEARLRDHPLVTTAAADRVRHARGQSLPDWVALRGGRIPAFPDGVAYPITPQDVCQLIRYAAETDTRLIPYGGGTSVVGHINPEPGSAPVLTVNLSRLNRLNRFDERSRLATFGAGISGPDLEAELRARGYTLGHFPQSWEWSTLGGWIAARSTGQQALGYGRIEDLFAGGRLESPAGTLDLPAFPASAAGPDLRQVVLGSEGRLGILTEATVRVTPLPEREHFHTVFFPDLERGLAAARDIAQARLPLSLLRLASPEETAVSLLLAGQGRLVGALEQLLRLRGVGAEKCMLLLGISGSGLGARIMRREALGIAGQHGGVHVGRRMGERWKETRFRAPYLRNTLWEHGYAIDTLETAAPWSRVPELKRAIEAALRSALEESGERVYLFTHLSHPYPSGSSIYTTYLFRVAADPEETLDRWRRLKHAASEAIVRTGGTISHQHGVGTDHLPYLAAEKGPLGMDALRALAAPFDPDRIMNPGKLFTEEAAHAAVEPELA